MSNEYQPKTGAKCGCRRGVWRDNCPNCEGTGWVINFAAIQMRRTIKSKPELYTCPNCAETVSGPVNYCGMLKCVWCHTAFEAEGTRQVISD